MFIPYVGLDFQNGTETMTERLDELENQLPGDSFVQLLRALHAYDVRGILPIKHSPCVRKREEILTGIVINDLDYDETERIFDEILERDPYRLDNLDVYSNVLYVLERRPKLSHLAHQCVSVEKFRFETCCVIGEPDNNVLL